MLDRLREEHERHGWLDVVVILELVVEHVGQLHRLLPVLRPERGLSVADHHVHEGLEDVAWQVAVLLWLALVILLLELFEINHYLKFLVVDF